VETEASAPPPPVETKASALPPAVEVEASTPSLSAETEDGAPPPSVKNSPLSAKKKASASLAVAGKSARSSALHRNESVGREKATVRFTNIVALVAATAVTGFFIYSTMKPRLAWRQK
jgi:hypothetical protein